MTELSWPIEKIEPHSDGIGWTVKLTGLASSMRFSDKELAAAGIPAEPYPAPPAPIANVVQWDVEDGGKLGCLIEGDGELLFRAYQWTDATGVWEMDTHTGRWEKVQQDEPMGDKSQPVTITVTVGDRSETVEPDDADVRWFLAIAGRMTPTGQIGAALRRLGVQP